MVLKLLGRLLVISGVILLICYSALYLNPDYKKEYVAGIASKLHKLKDVKVKKIVIIGGSNASFGIDTELMERQLGIPVVNMALHGGIPVKYIVEQVKPYVKSGDILVFSKEYEGLRNRDWNTLNGTEISKVATYDISQIRILFTDQKMFETTISNIFKTIKKYIKLHPIQGRKGISSVYDARAFRRDNLKSDYILGNYKLDVKTHELKKLGENSEVLKGLKRYKEYFERKKIDFYITPPVVIQGFFPEKEILPFWHFFSEKTGIPMLNNENTYTLNKKYFFNSHYHPNYQGRKIRTQLLIVDLINKGLVSKKEQITHKQILVGQNTNFNKASLNAFEAPYNFQILRKDKNQIMVKQSGALDHNYFRIKYDDVDYTGYHFYLHLECDSMVIDQIKFRGAAKLVDFDTIIKLGNNNYELWKKSQKVLYKNNNSYMGISFPNNEKLLNREFVVKDVGVFENFGMHDSFVNEYELNKNEGEQFYLEILSERESINLSEVIKQPNPMKNIKLESNRLYKIYVSKKKTYLEDFYKGTILFETKDDVVLKHEEDFVSRIYN